MLSRSTDATLFWCGESAPACDEMGVRRVSHHRRPLKELMCCPSDDVVAAEVERLQRLDQELRLHVLAEQAVIPPLRPFRVCVSCEADSPSMILSVGGGRADLVPLDSVSGRLSRSCVLVVAADLLVALATYRSVIGHGWVRLDNVFVRLGDTQVRYATLGPAFPRTLRAGEGVDVEADPNGACLLPPEAWRARGCVKSPTRQRNADVFSLGALLFHLLTGVSVVECLGGSAFVKWVTGVPPDGDDTRQSDAAMQLLAAMNSKCENSGELVSDVADLIISMMSRDQCKRPTAVGLLTKEPLIREGIGVQLERLATFTNDSECAAAVGVLQEVADGRLACAPLPIKMSDAPVCGKVLKYSPSASESGRGEWKERTLKLTSKGLVVFKDDAPVAPPLAFDLIMRVVRVHPALISDLVDVTFDRSSGGDAFALHIGTPLQITQVAFVRVPREPQLCCAWIDSIARMTNGPPM